MSEPIHSNLTSEDHILIVVFFVVWTIVWFGGGWIVHYLENRDKASEFLSYEVSDD